MRHLFVSARVIAAVTIWSLPVPAGAIAGGFGQTCQMPARLSCSGCVISCVAGMIPACRAGMSVWRGAAWSCSYQPMCVCRRSPWEIWQ